MIAVEIMDAHNLLLHLFLSVVLDSYFFFKLTIILTSQYVYFRSSQHSSSSICLFLVFSHQHFLHLFNSSAKRQSDR
jgi:hypothetical protein